MTDKGIMLGRHSLSSPKRNNSSAIFNSLLQGSQEEESVDRKTNCESSESPTVKPKCPCLTRSKFEKKLLHSNLFSLSDSKWCYESRRGQGLLPGRRVRQPSHVTQPRWVQVPERQLLATPSKATFFRGSRWDFKSELHWAKAFHSKSGAKRSTLSPSLPHSPPPFHQPHSPYATWENPHQPSHPLHSTRSILLMTRGPCESGFSFYAALKLCTYFSQPRELIQKQLLTTH